MGPWVDALASSSSVLGAGEAAEPKGSLICGIGGGGSMMWLEDFATTGSGNATIASSADEVSMVMCSVFGELVRAV